MSQPPEQHVAQARELIARYSYAKALSEAETALGGLERTSAGSLLHGEAYFLAGTAAFHLAEYPLAQEYLNHAAESFTTLNQMERVAACQIRLTECCIRQGDLRRAKHMAQQLAEQTAQEGWRHLHARALLSLGTAAWMDGNNREAIILLNQAIAEHEDLAEPDYAYRVRVSLGVAFIKEERHEEASILLEDCLQYFLAHKDFIHAVHCLNNLAGIAFHHDDLERAREYILQCTELQAELHHRGDLVISWYNLGLIEARLGNARLARKYLHRSNQVAQEIGDRTSEGSALLQLGLVALHEGQPDEALNFLNLARIPLNSAPAPQMNFLAAHLPVIHLACGHTELALELWPSVADTTDPEAVNSMRETLQLLTNPSHPLRSRLGDRERAIASEWLAELS